MVGDYEMETATGETFLVQVPAFSLDQPAQPGADPDKPQRPWLH
jgi:hypothetical protein